MADRKKWLQILAYVTGSINQGLLLRNEYLVAENRILKSQIQGRLRLSDGERATLAEIAKRLGRKALQEIACIAKPDTILAWYRKLVAQKFDGSKNRRSVGRPRVVTDSSGNDVRRALPWREKPSRQRKRSAISSGSSTGGF
jgi:hypothetical protein